MNSYKLSYLNPIRFHQIGIGDFAYNNIPSFEHQIGYNQIYVMGDRPVIQIISSTSSATMTMKLIDNAGVIYKTWGVYYSGYRYGSSGAWNYVYQWVNPFPYSTQISEGVYFLKLEISDWDGQLSFYSEPIKLTILAPENSVKLVYTHDENDFDTVFLATNVSGEFLIRIEGGVKSDGFQPGGKFTMFQDQDYQSVILQSQPYNVEKFTFGPSVGCPNWMGDKINRLFGLTSVKINDVSYSRNEGSKLERASENNNPLAAWSIDLIKSENPYMETYSIHDASAEPLTCDNTVITCDSELITSDQTIL